MGTYTAGHDAYYINGDSQTLAVVSAGGAVTSTTYRACHEEQER